MKTYVEFFNGQKMAIVGLGTWQATNSEELEKSIDDALSSGYRHFDTAYNYLNEDMIGKTLIKWLDSGKVKREELFVTSKLPMIAMQAERVGPFIQKSLDALQLDYIDLYLIHCPIGFVYVDDKTTFPTKDGKVLLDFDTDLIAIWKALEEQVDLGKVKAIGLSNFNSKQVEKIYKNARIQPANHQIEIHAYFQQKQMREFCEARNITLTSYGPLGSPGRENLYKARGETFVNPNIMENPIVKEIAEKCNKLPSQILIRFLAQSGISVIPKSVNKERIESNFNVFDFTISDEDMKKIETLDQGPSGRTFKVGTFPGAELHPENPMKESF